MTQKKLLKAIKPSCFKNVGPVWIKKGGKVPTECCLLTQEQLPEPVAVDGIFFSPSRHISWL